MFFPCLEEAKQMRTVGREKLLNNSLYNTNSSPLGLLFLYNPNNLEQRANLLSFCYFALPLWTVRNSKGLLQMRLWPPSVSE